MTRSLAGLALAAALAASAPPLRAQDSALVVLETHGNGLSLAKAISLPFEIALFPVHLLGHGVNQGLKWVEDRRVIAKVAVTMARIAPFSVRVGGLGEHSGLGPGLDVAFGDDGDRRWSAGAAANITTPGYQLHTAVLRYRTSPALAMTAFAEYKVDTQDEFYGTGATSALGDRSDYRYRRASAGVGVEWRPAARVMVEARAESRREETEGSARNALIPDLEDQFEGRFPAGFLSTYPSFRPAVRVGWDGTRRTARGPLGALGMLTYGYNRGARATDPSFHEVDVEARGYVPLGGLRRTLALRARVELRRADRGAIPFYRLAAVGGSRDLRAFRANRFRDTDGVLVTAEYRYRVWQDDRAGKGLDMVLFADDGAVVSDIFLGLGARDFHGGYGAGIRLTARDVLGRIEVAHGREGTRIQVRAGPLF